MSVVFLCREGLAARYLAHELHAAGRIDAIVVEHGREARRRKLRREWARTRWWKSPLFALDLAALAIYGRLWGRYLTQKMRQDPARSAFPAALPIHHVEDANDPACLSLLQGLAPDVMVVLGTSILGPHILGVPKELALNVHGGIVPRYRNVHSELWAVLDHDTANVGTSILHLDEGIDSGAIAVQGRVTGAHGFFDLRWRNVELAASLIREALERHEAGTLPREAQDGSQSGFYRTPGFKELFRLASKRVPSEGDLQPS